MSAEERRKILQMVADGKISAEEAATLMRSLEESAEEIQVIETESGSGGREAKVDAAEFDRVRERAKYFALIPLWVGIILTVLSAWWMFSIQRTAGLNFWFFCLSMPFLLGILLIALGAGSGPARWLYVNVDRSQRADWPKNITIALPLPLGLVWWFLKNFGSHIEGLKQTTVDEVIMAISAAKTLTEPLIINVDDDGGERVQVFIG
jgi:uncharacterized integral membrane protein